jgi:uracil phosphoribosyltransferase
LQPVEYYNNLPYHIPAVNTPSNSPNTGASELAILIDPVIATGGTAVAAIQTLKEWGVKRIIVISVLGALPGVIQAANEWPEGTEIWVAGLDEEVNDRGMIKPGLGDVGDRLFLTIGK